MQFITITSTYQKEITGVSRNYQLEITKKSFKKPSDEIIFNDFFRKNSKEFSRILLSSFISFPQDEISDALTLFPLGKKLKEIDFFRVCPHYRGIWVVVSQKVMDIFSKYHLPNFNKIRVHIDKFSNNYYLIGFPLTPIEDIDFKRSKFINRKNNEIVIFENVENYKNRENMFDILPMEIYLSIKYEYDILNLAGVYEICISPQILKELNQEKCIGFHEQGLDQLVVISE